MEFGSLHYDSSEDTILLSFRKNETTFEVFICCKGVKTVTVFGYHSGERIFLGEKSYLESKTEIKRGNHYLVRDMFLSFLMEEKGEKNYFQWLNERLETNCDWEELLYDWDDY